MCEWGKDHRDSISLPKRPCLVRTSVHNSALCIILCMSFVCRWNGGGGSGEDDTVGVDEGLPQFMGGAVISGGNCMSSRRKCSDEIIRLSIALHSVFWQNSIFSRTLFWHTLF